VCRVRCYDDLPTYYIYSKEHSERERERERDKWGTPHKRHLCLSVSVSVLFSLCAWTIKCITLCIKSIERERERDKVIKRPSRDRVVEPRKVISTAVTATGSHRIDNTNNNQLTNTHTHVQPSVYECRVIFARMAAAAAVHPKQVKQGTQCNAQKRQCRCSCCCCAAHD